MAFDQDISFSTVAAGYTEDKDVLGTASNEKRPLIAYQQRLRPFQWVKVVMSHEQSNAVTFFPDYSKIVAGLKPGAAQTSLRLGLVVMRTSDGMVHKMIQEASAGTRKHVASPNGLKVDNGDNIYLTSIPSLFRVTKIDWINV